MVDIMAFKNRAAAAINDVIPQFTKLLEEAYQAGYDEGCIASKQEAQAYLKTQMLSFFANMNTDDIPAKDSDPQIRDGSGHQEVDRLPPGTVKPTILKTIQEFPDGISIRDIEQLTGFKHSSVRGTVWLLTKEGSVMKGDGNLWAPVSKPDYGSLSPQSVETDDHKNNSGAGDDRS